jgi:hypothetical protein
MPPSASVGCGTIKRLRRRTCAGQTLHLRPQTQRRCRTVGSVLPLETSDLHLLDKVIVVLALVLGIGDPRQAAIAQ